MSFLQFFAFVWTAAFHWNLINSLGLIGCLPFCNIVCILTYAVVSEIFSFVCFCFVVCCVFEIWHKNPSWNFVLTPVQNDRIMVGCSTYWGTMRSAIFMLLFALPSAFSSEVGFVLVLFAMVVCAGRQRRAVSELLASLRGRVFGGQRRSDVCPSAAALWH